MNKADTITFSRANGTYGGWVAVVSWAMTPEQMKAFIGPLDRFLAALDSIPPEQK